MLEYISDRGFNPVREHDFSFQLFESNPKKKIGKIQTFIRNVMILSDLRLLF